MNGSNAHSPVAYRIDVNIDVDGEFTYTVNGFEDARRLQVRNGDTVSWTAKMLGKPVPFTVEFPDFSPFGITKRVVRSFLGPTVPQTVALAPLYHGNLVFKYTVTLENGWYDDPDIVPVPSDGVDTTLSSQHICLTVDSASLGLNPEDAQFAKGGVQWGWAGKPLDNFTLTFDDPVPDGWPEQTDSESEVIILDLETPGSQYYAIDTHHLGASVRGKLTIS
jgi:plastocyanin